MAMPSTISGWLTSMVALASLPLCLSVTTTSLAALGHAVAVVVDVELLERDVERQVLHEVAVAGIEEHHVGRAAFGQGDAAAERQVVGTQPAGIRDLALRQVASFRRDAAEEFGHFQRHVAVDQAADADDHEGDVGEEVAQLVEPSWLPASGRLRVPCGGQRSPWARR